jgi:hypothetical protein
LGEAELVEVVEGSHRTVQEASDQPFKSMAYVPSTKDENQLRDLWSLQLWAKDNIESIYTSV